MPKVKIEPEESSPKRPDQTDSTNKSIPKRPEFMPETIASKSLPSGPEDHPRAGVENLIKEHASTFNTEEKLRTMKGGPMNIKLKDGPSRQHTKKNSICL